MSDDEPTTPETPDTPDAPDAPTDDATEAVEAETAAAPVPAAAPAGVKVKPDKGKRWQRIVSVVLLVLGFILVPLSAVAIWTHNQLTNTDRYVETVSPLAENKDIQQTVAAAVVNAIFTGNIEKRVANALPKRAKPLAAPIASAAQSYALDVTEKLLASQQFSDLWDAANRRAHNQLVALLTDDPGKAPGAVNIKDGKVKLDLTNVITQVQGKLVDAGLSFLKNVNVPPVSRTITIIDTEGLSEARTYVSILDTLAWVLPVLGILCLAGSALIVPPRRRRLTVRAALVLVAACAFTLVLLAIGRSLYLDATVNKDAAKAVFDILVRNLRYGVITLAVVGVIIALVAYFAGPSAPAKATRRLAGAGIAGARTKAGDLGYPPNPVEEFVGAHKRLLELVIAGLAVVALVVWDQPGVGAVLFLFVIALLLVGVVEFLARGSVPETADDTVV
ncbi:MAG TPA: hypothetical protein VGN51_24905 [Acidimicrobiia bacterium]|jgi:hypothetical protein